MQRKLTAALGSVVALLFTATGQASAEELPVSYNFFGGIVPELTTPGGSLPGR